MWSGLHTLALGMCMLQCLVTGLSSSRHIQSLGFTRRDLSVVQVQTELGELVSANATIFGPADPRFENATERWSTHAVPDIEVVVVPATEEDVTVIVKYCNENSIDFLAVNRAHARTYSVGAFSGLMIDLAGLRGIDMQPDNSSAWFQGGTYSGQVTDFLWERGLVTTTGSCDCVGMMGPGLGGGHGRHQGLYGLISDNILNLNVVLANGTALQVNESSHADLFWAMKGAGHNYGIVTSFELKTYPKEVDTWHYHNYIWTEDKLEDVFTAANSLYDNGSMPVNMAANFVSFALNESISETKPIIYWTSAYRGSADEAETILAPLNKIEAVYQESGEVAYPNISLVQGTSIDSATCADNHTWIMSTAGLKTLNITAIRQIYELNVEQSAQYPDLSPAVTYEVYSTEAVQEIKSENSAFPFREYGFLTTFNLELHPGSNLTSVAREWADTVRGLWNSGQPDVQPSDYVNYATGLTSLGSMYGSEEWRLSWLLDLKAQYDPENHFRFYNPLVRD